MSFQKIAERLNTTPLFVSKAYRQYHQEATLEAAKKGKAAPKGRYVKLPADKHRKIDKLLQETTLSYREIGRQVGADKWTILANRDRLLAEGKHVPVRPLEKRSA